MKQREPDTEEQARKRSIKLSVMNAFGKVVALKHKAGVATTSQEKELKREKLPYVDIIDTYVRDNALDPGARSMLDQRQK